MFSYYLSAIKQYNTSRGRSRRKEYWSVMLMNNLVIFLLIPLLGALISTMVSEVVPDDNIVGDIGANIASGFFVLYLLIVLLPSVRVTIRRLHDRGLSGWFLLIGIIPALGFLVIFYQLCRQGNRGHNQYGPDPRAASA